MEGIDDAKLIAAMEKLDGPMTNAACAKAYDYGLPRGFSLSFLMRRWILFLSLAGLTTS